MPSAHTASVRASGFRPENVAPRIGLTYDPTGSGKTIFRANYGLFSIAPRQPGSHSPPPSMPTPFRSSSSQADLPALLPAPSVPLNLNATNTFQGSLSNANCLPVAGLNYLPSQQRFDADNSASVFINQNFLASGFPLAILPSGLPADLHYRTPYVQQISFGIERDLGHNLSINIAYNNTGGRHLNRPVNVNPVNPRSCEQLARGKRGRAGWNRCILPGGNINSVAGPTSNPLTVGDSARYASMRCRAQQAPTSLRPCSTSSAAPASTPRSHTSSPRRVPGSASRWPARLPSAEGLGVGSPCPLRRHEPQPDHRHLQLQRPFRQPQEALLNANYEFLVSYTLSHAIDDSTDVVSTADAPQNNFNPERRTRHLNLRPAPPPRHIRASTTPGTSAGAGFLPGVFSGFTVAPIIEISSGRPFNIVTGTDTNFDFDPLTDRPNAVAANSGTDELRHSPSAPRFSPTGYLNLPCYIDAPPVQPRQSAFNGTLARNTGIRPYTVFTDLRIARSFSFSQRPRPADHR